MLADWRRDARYRLPELQRAGARRAHRAVGELAHLSVPDLKEARGGLRDATVLKALVATWLVDVPHADLERCRRQLLDVRDVLHEIAGRGTDRIAPGGVVADLAARSGSPTTRRRSVTCASSAAGSTHLSRLTWRRVDAVLAAAGRRAAPGRPDARRRSAPGVRALVGEVVLAAAPGPADDPLLLLRAAAEAAERDVVLAPATAARLVRERRAAAGAVAGEARQLLVRLLGAGPGLLPVWETLEETGRWSGCCRSGSGSGCCRTPRRSTASPSTGTWWRPASRRPR